MTHKIRLMLLAAILCGGATSVQAQDVKTDAVKACVKKYMSDNQGIAASLGDMVAILKECQTENGMAAQAAALPNSAVVEAAYACIAAQGGGGSTSKDSTPSAREQQKIMKACFDQASQKFGTPASPSSAPPPPTPAQSLSRCIDGVIRKGNAPIPQNIVVDGGQAEAIKNCYLTSGIEMPADQASAERRLSAAAAEQQVLPQQQPDGTAKAYKACLEAQGLRSPKPGETLGTTPEESQIIETCIKKVGIDVPATQIAPSPPATPTQ